MTYFPSVAPFRIFLLNGSHIGKSDFVLRLYVGAGFLLFLPTIIGNLRRIRSLKFLVSLNILPMALLKEVVSKSVENNSHIKHLTHTNSSNTLSPEAGTAPVV